MLERSVRGALYSFLRVVIREFTSINFAMHHELD